MGMVDYLDYTYWMVYLQFLKYENENYLYPSLKVFLAKPEMLDGLIFLSGLCSLHVSALIFSGVVELYALIGHVLRVDPSIDHIEKDL